jgi:predicted lactoylglutathione lyase
MKREPYYTIDFSASACNFEILINDIPVVSMEIEGQVSTNIPINYAIYDSGSQSVVAKITPLFGEVNLHPEAGLKYNVRLFDVANNEFNLIEDFPITELPKIEKEQKLPFITNSKEFSAEIFYSLTKWNDAENLKDQDNIKERLIASYNYLAELIKNEKYDEFVERIRIRERNMATSMYLSSAESRARINGLIDDAKNGFKIMPFPKDTVLKFYGYGKLATFKKLNGEPALFLYNSETQEELMIDQMFYIPKGKTELEVI